MYLEDMLFPLLPTQLDVEIAETKGKYEKLEENWTKMKVGKFGEVIL